MMIPENLKYSKEHEWVKVEGETALVGITHHAQDALGDLVYIELPKVGAKLSSMQEFGVAESVKTVSTLYCPVGGEVVAVNEELKAKPEIVNEDPYEKGWMLKVKMSSPAEAGILLSAKEYGALLAK
ncbi:MAG: glycine cleavage system protein GcvH [Candidatus Saganbacteria bacterium]|nr:glycine cleavage system protein GcvH [Candidatus Saganbacteria bacterium]